MKTFQFSRRLPVVAFAAVMLVTLGVGAQNPPDFQADGRFTGSSLTGWRVVGPATWKAENGELIGRATDPAGGWLLTDKPLQDLQFFANLKCSGPCKAGVLLRGEKMADGGMHVQAPLHAKLIFRPVDAEMIGDEWTATKVDIDLQITRKAFKKTVRISPTTIGTLTCDAYHQGDHFVATLIPT
jgi:hypothetical protein